MALNIKDEETDRLARELAAATGESITEAARNAIRERLHRVRAQRVSDGDRLVVREIIERARREAIVDTRSDEDILGYDDRGLPL